MSTALTTVSDGDVAKLVERVVIGGDLSGLSPAERVKYYNAFCQSMGLNPLTKPFEYIKLSGKLTLYARRDAADQLRKIHDVSIKITSRELIGDVYVVTAEAFMPSGRVDCATGAVAVKGLSGDNLANAYLKCETKAKRRVTLSICGLGILDETEVETVSRAPSPIKAQEVNEILSSELAVEIMPDEPDFVTEAAADGPPDLGQYIIPIGKKYKGKKLSQVAKPTLSEFVAWVESNVENKTDQTLEFLETASAYLEQAK